MILNTEISPELNEWRIKIEHWAKEYGLDFYETIFEVLDWNQINMVAAYGGFPNRYPHWRWGMEYEQLSKSYAYGLSKIYEMVINNDPCYAYLLHSNNLVDQKMVIAHVFAHCDFFKNNIFFGPTQKNMMDQMANHKTRLQRYIDQIGYDRVETFVDTCLSIDNLIDYQRPFLKNKPVDVKDEEDEKKIEEARNVHKLRVDKHYLEEYINPKAFLDLQKEKQEQKEKEETKFPQQPELDIMGFLLEHAPLSRWEYDILHIIRREAYYFAPQAQTKIMNEGWASYWHSRIMTEKAVDPSELIDFADHHSGTMAMSPQQINPYKIGIELFRHIEERWDKGRFGKEYNDCEDMVEKKKWDKQLGLGQQKIFEVRRIYNDIMFLDEFLTAEFCRENKFFAYTYNPLSNRYEISDRDFPVIKQKLLTQLTNFGQPIIAIVDANQNNRGELKLDHRHYGIDLDIQYARETLQNLFTIWKRPVSIQTKLNNNIKIYTYDGKEHKILDSKEGP
ncbi:MAG: SpoVR family protein [bacterium]|nr:SpoVR family protein [bacterium]MBU1918183.1 SpoVR family protein [bacterium]